MSQSQQVKHQQTHSEESKEEWSAGQAPADSQEDLFEFWLRNQTNRATTRTCARMKKVCSLLTKFDQLDPLCWDMALGLHTRPRGGRSGFLWQSRVGPCRSRFAHTHVGSPSHPTKRSGTVAQTRLMNETPNLAEVFLEPSQCLPKVFDSAIFVKLC